MRSRRMCVHGLLVGLGLALARCAAAADAAASWSPAGTFAFVVGVLEWKDGATWPPFPKTDRRDRQLVRLLEERGVPRDHIVYLEDREATRDAVHARFRELLSRTRPGDLLLVYYAGHGSKDEDGRAYFATWDAGADMEATAWPMDRVVRDLETHARGTRALLLADCCYSGTLAELSRSRSKQVAMAALTSSSASVASTGNWTFTESVLLGLRGSPEVDADRDGAVTLRGIARFTGRELLFADEQRSTFDTAPGFDPALRMAASRGEVKARVGEHVEALDGGTWWKARVIDARRGELRVHYYGYETGDDAWLPLARVRSPQMPEGFAQGAHVEVLWKETWYPATVLRADSGLHYIHYDGYDASWDEWIGSRLIRKAR